MLRTMNRLSGLNWMSPNALMPGVFFSVVTLRRPRTSHSPMPASWPSLVGAANSLPSGLIRPPKWNGLAGRNCPPTPVAATSRTVSIVLTLTTASPGVGGGWATGFPPPRFHRPC